MFESEYQVLAIGSASSDYWGGGYKLYDGNFTPTKDGLLIISGACVKANGEGPIYVLDTVKNLNIASAVTNQSDTTSTLVPLIKGRTYKIRTLATNLLFLPFK